MRQLRAHVLACRTQAPLCLPHSIRYFMGSSVLSRLRCVDWGNVPSPHVSSGAVSANAQDTCPQLVIKQNTRVFHKAVATTARQMLSDRCSSSCLMASNAPMPTDTARLSDLTCVSTCASRSHTGAVAHPGHLQVQASTIS